jgi:cell division protein FtsL
MKGGYESQYLDMTAEEQVLRAKDKWGLKKSLVRARPGYPHWQSTDDSPSSFEFICKCKRISGIMSNSLFEAMLCGRTSQGYGQHPYSFMETNGIEDEREFIAPLDFLNFAIFAYMIPVLWMTNPGYLNFRLSASSETEIYNRGFEHWTKDITSEDLAFYYTGDGYEYRFGDRMWFLPDYPAHQSALYYAVSGLSHPETDKTWSEGEFTEFTFDLTDTSQALKIVFCLESVYLDRDVNNRQIVTCYVNGEYSGEKVLYVESRELTFILPQELLKNRITIKLHYSNAAEPPLDGRLIAIAYKWFEITVASEQEQNVGSLEITLTHLLQENEQVTTERDALTTERDALTMERDALTMERDALTVERDTLTAERDTLTTERDALTTERDALTTERDTLTAERDALTTERDTLTAERDALTAERDALTAERDALTTERDTLINSTSWKITKPFRAVGDLFN